MPQDCVLFNDTALYNIAYGGVGLIDYTQKETELSRVLPGKVEEDELSRDINNYF